MTDREHIERNGPGRRKSDHVCVFHDLLQAETKEHREMIRKKIAAKADDSALRGLKGLIITLVSISCLVIAGQAVWLMESIKDVKQDAISAVKATDSKIDVGFSTLHRRITENINDASEDRNEIKKQLNTLATNQAVTNHRLGQIEESHKVLKK